MNTLVRFYRNVFFHQITYFFARILDILLLSSGT